MVAALSREPGERERGVSAERLRFQFGKMTRFQRCTVRRAVRGVNVLGTTAAHAEQLRTEKRGITKEEVASITEGGKGSSFLSLKDFFLRASE